MRVLKHLTANDVQLVPRPFRRELSMEAYLIENENVLALDDDVFSDVSIIQEELTLKQGRSSKDTDGRIDILITYSSEYIGIVELKLGELKEVHLKQLEDYLIQKETILEEYPDIVDTDGGCKWIGLIVGNSIDPVLAQKISNGYVTKDNVEIAALTIQRFRDQDGRVYVATDVYFKQNSSNKDYTKYLFKGKTHGKGRLVLEVLKAYVEDYPETTFADLERKFPKKIQGSMGVFDSLRNAEDKRENSGRKRHFLESDELIKLSDETIAVNSQWKKENIETFIKQAKKLGYEIS